MPTTTPFVAGVDHPELAALVDRFQRRPGPGASPGLPPEVRVRWIEAKRAQRRLASIAGLESLARMNGLSRRDQIIADRLEVELRQSVAFVACSHAARAMRRIQEPLAVRVRQRRAVSSGVLQVYQRSQLSMENQIHRIPLELAEGWVPSEEAVRVALESLEHLEPTPLEAWADLPTERRVVLESAAQSWRATAEVYTQVLRDAKPHALPRRTDRACYAAHVIEHTDGAFEPAELHALGLRELADIEAEVIRVGGRFFDVRDAEAVFRLLRAHPARFEDGTAMVRAAEAVIVEADRIFDASWLGQEPAFPCSVAPIEQSWPLSWVPSGAYRDRTFLIRTDPSALRPYELRTVTFHECIPGHHVQILQQGTTSGWPVFMHRNPSTAFVEGWAHYAEALADEAGLYPTELDRLGYLSHRAWRAVRLVVDTGLHDQGWTRLEARAFMRVHTALDVDLIDAEIERYLQHPGQALAYKVGELEIQRLRSLAEAELGDDFDLPGFHRCLLGIVGAPLGSLEREVRSWIAEVLDRPGGPPSYRDGSGR